MTVNVSVVSMKVFVRVDRKQTYTCPSSWATVNAALRPLSLMMEQLRNGSHIVPSSAKPEKPPTPYITELIMPAQLK